MPPSPQPIPRRELLSTAGLGFGSLALHALRPMNAAAAPTLPDGPATSATQTSLTPIPPQLTARAKQVIFLFQYGGPSGFDLFDHKPLLTQLHGKPVPQSFKQHADKVGGVFNHCRDELMAGPWNWQRYGECGHAVSELLPHTARHIDRLCQIRSMVSDSSNHAPATYLMNTGAILGGRPSLGSWITYGLGSLNQNLPGYVLLYKVGGLGGSANWSNAFLPAAHQGTRFRHDGDPVLYLRPPEEFRSTQRQTLDFAQWFNQRHAAARPGAADLEGRIAAAELAYRMQSTAIDVGDLARETTQTQQAYGLDDPVPGKALYGRMCLLGRRLIEQGVRFVQIYNAVDKLGWDGHDNNTDYNRRNAMQTDQPVAALLQDLDQRGLLDSTLVIWAGEFGRTPMMQGSSGRNHNPYGFTIWMAGAGVQGGRVIGSTDEIGLRAAESPQTIRNLHATILTALGIQPDELYFEHLGRQERLTGVAKSWSLIPGVLG